MTSSCRVRPSGDHRARAPTHPTLTTPSSPSPPAAVKRIQHSCRMVEGRVEHSGIRRVEGSRGCSVGNWGCKEAVSLNVERSPYNSSWPWPPVGAYRQSDEPSSPSPPKILSAPASPNICLSSPGPPATRSSPSPPASMVGNSARHGKDCDEGSWTRSSVTIRVDTSPFAFFRLFSEPFLASFTLRGRPPWHD